MIFVWLSYCTSLIPALPAQTWLKFDLERSLYKPNALGNFMWLIKSICKRKYANRPLVFKISVLMRAAIYS